MKRMSGEEADKYLGVSKGKLSRCPDMPNCVCSQYEDDGPHFVTPLAYKGDGKAAMERLKSLLTAKKGVTVVKHDGKYLHVQFKTKLLKFTDDVEFLLDDAEQAIHVRSASRLGYSDLGANRRRVESLRKEFEE